jgi:hypothetical protein
MTSGLPTARLHKLSWAHSFIRLHRRSPHIPQTSNRFVCLHAKQANNIPEALAAVSNEKIDVVVVVLQTKLLLNMSDQISAIALEKRLPTVFGYREHEPMAAALTCAGVHP